MINQMTKKVKFEFNFTKIKKLRLFLFFYLKMKNMYLLIDLSAMISLFK